MTENLQLLKETFLNSTRVLIAAHVNPDGDALGSAAGLGHLLTRMGKEVRLYLLEPVPQSLAWLDLPWPVISSLADAGGWTPDLLALIDCAEAYRAGPEINAWLTKGVLPGPAWEKTASLNIDHHLGNPGFAAANWVDSGMSSTGEMIGHAAEYCGFRLEGELGLALYLALVSDTGNFTFSNTSASCLAMASRILACGLSLRDFTEKHENVWSLDSMHLWGKLMSRITLSCGGQVASARVETDLLRQYKVDKSALEGFASWLRRIAGVKVGIFVRQEENGASKASLRSSGDVDVRAIAARYGGGGHKAAAGVELPVPPEEAEKILIRAAGESLGCKE